MSDPVTTFPTSSPDAAAFYLTRGLAPVPLDGRTKRVTFAGWQAFRADPADLWRFADHNVGLLLGGPSGGVYDVDLDCPEAVAAADVLLPPTGLVYGRPLAPRSHRLYACPDEPDYLGLTDPVGAGDREPGDAKADDKKLMLVELRNTGKQSMAPPSVHPDTAEVVAWSSLGEPGRIGAGDLVKGVRRVAAAALLGRYWPKNSRHFAALALAGGLLRTWGNDAEAVSKFVRAVAAAAGDDEAGDRVRAVRDTADALAAGGAKVTGWPKLAELLGACGRAVVDRATGWLGVTPAWERAAAGGSMSGMSGVGCESRTTYTPIPPDVPFPVDILPGPWADLVREGARVLKCDAGLVALPAISVLASAVGMTRRIYLGGEWYAPAVLWTCTVLESGGLKSPAARVSTGIVEAVQKKHLAAHKSAMTGYTAELKEYRRAQKSRRGGRDDSPGDDPEEPTKPVLKRVLVKDITIEKLAGILDDNPRGLLKYNDELTTHLSSFTRYKGQTGGSDEGHWLSIYDGDALVYDRKTGDKTSVFVPHVAVSVAGGIQPGVLKRLMTKGLFDSGTVARFVFRLAERTPKEYVEEAIAPDVKERAEKSLKALYTLEPEADEDELPKPKVVKLGADARRRWKRFVNEWGRKQFETDGALAAALSKQEGMAARFALVHHLVTFGEAADTRPVEVTSVEAGIRYAGWAAYETVRVYRTLNESDDAAETRMLVGLVTRLAEKSDAGDRVTGRDLQRSRGERYPTVESAEAALDSLVGLGVGTWGEPEGKAGRGGKVSRPFILNPTPDIPDIPDDDEGEGDPGEPDNDPDMPPKGGEGAPAPADKNLAETNGSGENAPPARPPMSGVGSGSAGSEHGVATPTPAGAMSGEHVGAARGFMWMSELMDAGPVVVASGDALTAAFWAVKGSARVGLDLETTGLNPRTDRVRLLSLDTDGGVFLIDCFAVNPRPLWGVLAEAELVGHNLLFDLPFLARMGYTPGRVCDTLLASQVLDAGTPGLKHSLKDAAARHLGVTLDKTEQASDWSGDLSPSQFAYAASDVATTVALADALLPKLAADRLTPVLDLECRALPAVAWMAAAGVGFDRAAWAALADEAEGELARLTAVLDDLAPAGADLFGTAGRNWNSPDQVRAAFLASGIELGGTDDAALAAVDHPLAAALREHRASAKRCGTYGRAWLRHVASAGRVYPGWKQIGAERTGRMSCGQPNAQNLPRDARYRRCFAAPPGRVLVKADYSQVELRLAARISGDAVMLAAYRAGKDLHAETARAVLGRAEVTKADRQLAKALNFGLLYGMGAKGFAAYARNNYGVALTEGEAARHRAAFFRTYPGLKRWHGTAGDRARDTFTVLGRRRKAVGSYPERLNSPVQGSGGDGVKAALAYLWERRDECPGAVPVLAVHDELVVECDVAAAEVVKAWLVRAMVDGMTPFADPVPVVVDASVGATWGG